MADEILMAAFCDELEKVAASRSFFGKLPQIRLPNLLGKKPKVPFEERKCNKCGQPGYIAVKCPKISN